MATFVADAGSARPGQFPPSGPRKIVSGLLTLSSEGQGTSIPATVFGLAKLEEISAMIDNSNGISYTTVPSFDGAYMLVRNVATNGFSAISGVFRLTVRGY